MQVYQIAVCFTQSCYGNRNNGLSYEDLKPVSLVGLSYLIENKSQIRIKRWKIISVVDIK
jgi:hypothetical protein